jgi:hypothetical protein
MRPTESLLSELGLAGCCHKTSKIILTEAKLLPHSESNDILAIGLCLKGSLPNLCETGHLQDAIKHQNKSHDLNLLDERFQNIYLSC